MRFSVGPSFRCRLFSTINKRWGRRIDFLSTCPGVGRRRDTITKRDDIWTRGLKIKRERPIENSIIALPAILVQIGLMDQNPKIMKIEYTKYAVKISDLNAPTKSIRHTPG